MTDNILQAFFIGRATAEVLSERLEASVTQALAEIGKFDAEQRENFRIFTEEVLARAEQEARQAEAAEGGTGFQGETNHGPEDEQQIIDELRADIARTRAEIKAHRI